MFYIKSVYLKNIRCFKEIDFDFTINNKPAKWIMILGDNSTGKTCLLRSIALGMCDEASAAALMKEIPGEFIKSGSKNGTIKLTLTDGKNDYELTTEIYKKNLNSPERVKQKYSSNFNWDSIFICAYGTNRAMEADRSFFKYSPLEAVYTLFNYSSPLQNPEIILQRNKSIQKNIEAKLFEILMLDRKRHRLLLTEKGLIIKGPWGNIPIEVLSDGYRSTTYWLLDFFAWQIYAKKYSKPGVLIIDEIEQHIHPKWQRYIVAGIRNQLKKIQMVTSTHTPLVLLGLSDIEDAKIINLKFIKNRYDKEYIKPSELSGMRADQALTYAFDLSIARSGLTTDSLNTYRDLYLKNKLSIGEKREFYRLKNKLRRTLPSAAASEEDREVLYEIKNILKKYKL